MSSIPVSPVAAGYSQGQPPLPTPSPFSFSVASTAWSSRPPIQTANIFLRYCFIVNILAFFYAAYQLFKGVCDISHRGIFISDMVSDYISFIFDQQLAGYLLVSASSVAVQAIQQMHNGNSPWRATLISVCMSFASFLVIAANALLSGYRFCKRIIW